MIVDSIKTQRLVLRPFVDGDAADVLALIEEVQRRIEEKNGVRLTPKIRIVGEDA